MAAALRILVLGGDGFCGWPCALHLSALGHEVTIADDFSRRRMEAELGAGSLTPIATMEERLAAWWRVAGRTIGFARIDVAAEPDVLRDLLAHLRPDAVVHFAEQRSAPYSMISPAHRRRTVSGNIGATHGLLAALVEAGVDAHVVHLGSVGVYGYAGQRTQIPEGYHLHLGDGAPRQVLYPTDAGSIYHMTKAMDQLLFAFYSKNEGMRITDLHQGIVWGTQTAATADDPLLVNRFDYDGVFGTVLNRFVLQAALGEPLSVYGTGGQARGFIHLSDTVRSIQLVLASPPAAGGRVRIINQVGEVLAVRDLAARVARLAGVEVAHVPNPRGEEDTNSFPVSRSTLCMLGLRPVLVDDRRLEAELALARAHAWRADRAALPSRVRWQ